MAQQVQPNVVQAQQETQKPVVQTTQPIAGQTQQREVEKISILKKFWFWFILGLFLGVGIGVGISFLFFV